jgi:hypothetical protein
MGTCSAVEGDPDRSIRKTTKLAYKTQMEELSCSPIKHFQLSMALNQPNSPIKHFGLNSFCLHSSIQSLSDYYISKGGDNMSHIESLEYLGFPGYSVDSRGWVINASEVVLRGNQNGQVSLINSEGKQVWKKLAWLVATVFVENPNDYLYVLHSNGDYQNNDYRNLEWTNSRSKKNPKLVEMLRIWREYNIRDPYKVAEMLNVSVAYVKWIEDNGWILRGSKSS